MILTARTLRKANMRHCAKFRADQWNRRYDRFVSIFQDILDLLYACLDYPRRVFGGICHCAKFI